MKRRIAVSLFIVILLALTISCGNSSGNPLTVAELLELGEKHLLDMEYEQALMTFLRVIRIDPKVPRGYTGAAEAYIGLDRPDLAISILWQGLDELPGNEEISSMLQELQGEQGDPENPEDPEDPEQTSTGNEADDPDASQSPEPDPTETPATSDPTATPGPDVPVIIVGDEEYRTDLIRLNLVGLNLTDADIEPLRHMRNLSELYLAHNQISDVGALRGLTTLTRLYLDDNIISDISALGSLTNLTHLWLGDNDIGNIDALSGLTSLTDLDLRNNRIYDASALISLTGLSGLYLEGNLLSDISPFRSLVNLEDLWLYDNLFSAAQINELRAALPHCDIWAEP